MGASLPGTALRVDDGTALYSAQRPTELSDRMQFSGPTPINRLMASHAFHTMARAQPETWNALERAGFRVDPYGDIQEAINIRLGGHYIDVGTSAKIAKGPVRSSPKNMARFFGGG